MRQFILYRPYIINKIVKLIHFNIFTKHLMKEISFHMSLDFIFILPTSQNDIEIYLSIISIGKLLKRLHIKYQDELVTLLRYELKI